MKERHFQINEKWGTPFTQRTVKGSSCGRRNTIPVRKGVYAKINEDLEMINMKVNIKIFSYFKCLNNWLSTAKILTINFELTSMYKGKMYDKNSINEKR